MKNVLVILSHPEHDREGIHQGVHLALNLAMDAGVDLRVFLMAGLGSLRPSTRSTRRG